MKSMLYLPISSVPPLQFVLAVEPTLKRVSVKALAVAVTPKKNEIQF